MQLSPLRRRGLRYGTRTCGAYDFARSFSTLRRSKGGDVNVGTDLRVGHDGDHTSGPIEHDDTAPSPIEEAERHLSALLANAPDDGYAVLFTEERDLTPVRRRAFWIRPAEA